jgi:hypothetical protein
MAAEELLAQLIALLGCAKQHKMCILAHSKQRRIAGCCVYIGAVS